MDETTPAVPPESFKYSLGTLEAALRDTEEPEQIIAAVLHAAAEYYGADRAYILEADRELGIFTNTYEHCRDGVPSQIQLLQSIPFEKARCLEKTLKRNVPIVLSDAERLEQHQPESYDLLHSLDIHSMIAVPMKKTYNSGFLCVDNPTVFADSPDYLLMLAYVSVSELNEITLRDTVATYRRNLSKNTGTEITINCLGRLEIITPKGTLTTEDFTSDLLCSFLLYLVLNRKRITSPRETVEMVWEESTGDPYLHLKNAANRLRNVLGRIEMDSLIIPCHGTFILNPEYQIYTDLDRLENLCEKMMVAEEPEVLDGLYRDTSGLYRGNLVPRIDYCHWLIPYSVHYSNLYLRAVRRYAERMLEAKKYREAEQAVVENLTLFPQDGILHGCLVQALRGQGNMYHANMVYKAAERYSTGGEGIND